MNLLSKFNVLSFIWSIYRAKRPQNFAFKNKLLNLHKLWIHFGLHDESCIMSIYYKITLNYVYREAVGTTHKLYDCILPTTISIPNYLIYQPLIIIIIEWMNHFFINKSQEKPSTFYFWFRLVLRILLLFVQQPHPVKQWNRFEISRFICMHM